MQRYPLQWPEGWKRHHTRSRAKFGKSEHYRSHPESQGYMRKQELTINDGTQRVLRELRAFGVLDGDAIISTNLQVRLDGLPRSGQRVPDDPGVAVYWKRPGDNHTKVMAVDRYDRVADNLAAIAATLEAMRAIERHGGAQILARAFQGFIALPAPGGTTTKGWREVFGLPPDAVVYRSQLDAAYRTLRSASHPDHGGSADAFNTVQSAYEQAKQEIVA